MLNIYYKPITQCNLNCLHCYVPEEHKKDKNILNIDKTIEIFEKILIYASNKKEPVNIIFHGGEPMLMGIEYYSSIYKYFKNTDNINFSLQTNLTLYNPSWDYIIENMFNSRIGTSFDLCRRLNNSFLKFFRIWNKKYKEALNKFDIYIDITVTKQFLEKGIIFWNNFFKKMNFKRYGFEYFLPLANDIQNNQNLFYPYKDYLKFLMDYCDFLEKKGEEINFYPLNISNRNSRYIFSSGPLSGKCIDNRITIMPNGDISFCPCMDGIVIFGNIFQSNLESIMNSKKRISLIIKANLSNCFDCKYNLSCIGGCYAYRIIHKVSSIKDNTDGYCEKIHEYINKHIK